jgi:hypothetical protein
MKRTRHKTDIDYNFNELYIMVKTNVKISREIFL